MPQATTRLVIEGIQSDPSPNTDCDLPAPSQRVDIFNVPVGQEHELVVHIGFAHQFSKEIKFRVTAKGPGIKISKGSETGTVTLTVAKKNDTSDTFFVEGMRVEDALLNVATVVDDLGTPDPNDDRVYPTHDFTVVVWTLADKDIVDYAALSAPKENEPPDENGCFDVLNSPALKPDMHDRTTCGQPAAAVAADGTSLQLIRLKATGYGRACFTVVPSDPPVGTREQYYGKFSDPIAGGASTDSPATNVTSVPYQGPSDPIEYQWAFGTYTPPSEFFSTLEEPYRKVEVEVQFTALLPNGVPTRSHITALRKTIKIARPPVLLVHGLWSDHTTWNDYFTKPANGRRRVDGDYDYPNTEPYSTQKAANDLRDHIRSLIYETRRDSKMATTKVDIIAHSMGGLRSHRWISDANYLTDPFAFKKGNVRKLATVATPHWGSRLANALINLHDAYPESDEALQMLEGSLKDIHAGAICEVAENSSALQFGEAQGAVVRAYTASGGDEGNWHIGINQALKYFSVDVERPIHTDPYVYHEKNDGIVSRVSQRAGESVGSGLPETNFSNLLHSVVGPLSLVDRSLTVTGSLSVANQIYSDLDRPEGWATSLPGFQVAASQVGVPLRGGRGAQIDHENFVSQCTPGSPGGMYPLQ